MNARFLRLLPILPAAAIAVCGGHFGGHCAVGQVIQSTDATGSKTSRQSDEDAAPVVPWVLHPAAEPRRALQYQLLPKLLNRRPGNAAVMYNKIALRMAEGDRAKQADEVEKYLDTPIDELPQADVEKALLPFRGVIEDLALAGRCEQCDWQLPIREKDFIRLLLPEVQYARRFARLLSVQAKLQIARGQFDEAIETLQTGFALGRHVAEGPTLVNALVGMAIGGIMAEELQTLIQQPGAPNLYWALTALPRPLIDLRKGVETEMHMFHLSFPELAELDDDTHSAEYWQVFLDRLSAQMAQWGAYNGSNRMQPWHGRLAMALLAVKAYPVARQALLTEGRTAEEVDAMPVPRLVALHTMRTYEELRDGTYKWFHVPYADAREGMQRAEDNLRRSRRREVFPLASMMLPAVSACRTAEARTARTIALLRVLEALRMHAAENEGQLPENLGDVTVVPVPDDPMTGQPFYYRLQGDTARLEAVAPEGLDAERYHLRYEIRLAR
ncbi:MAG: hypothetical protein HQ581_14195 [Planctomycetes bacterium]|nr:hypothetical protein [Planctomycetota bacterium]